MQEITIKKRPRWIVPFVMTVVLLFLIAVLVLSWFGFELFFAKGDSVAGFTVEEGEGVNQISRDLHAAGVVKSKLVFETYLWLRNMEGSIKAGTYEIPSVNLVDLTNILMIGPEPVEQRITLIEGWTLDQYADALAERGLVDRDSFLDKVKRPVSNGYTAARFPILYSKPDEVDLEGYLFPDTYRFFDEVTEEEVVEGLINTLTQRITEQMAKDVDSQGKTLHEILTMASIIEKEVRTDRDRRLVSGLLWKRISEGIPLQVDSTVNYITGGDKPAVSIAETQIDNPFNTYKYAGLPPGPISNPGLSAIMAAIYPTESDYYYFLSTPEGETIFSETYDQHVAAKREYLK